MDLAEFLSVLRRWWLILVASVALGVGGAVVVTQNSPVVYASNTRLFVSVPLTPGIDESLQAVRLSSELLQSYARIATSREVASRVAEDLNLSEGTVRSAISAVPLSGTLMLEISASATNPRNARNIADAAARELSTLVRELEAGNAVTRPRVIDRATLPTAPISPDPLRNLLLGIILGGGFGLAAVWALEALDRTVRDPQQATTILGRPMLAMVPRRRDARSHPLLSAEDVGSPSVEAYRVLRTAARFIRLDGPIRSILVTSASAGDGKTLTAANVAVAFAQAGERVILVDADLRRSRLPEVFDLSGHEDGLTSVVIGQAGIEESLVEVGDRLSVLPSGPRPPNPSEILGSEAMARLLGRLQQLADVVVFDAPPVLAVTDAQVLSTQVDATILVVRHGRTRRNLLAEARRRLEVVGTEIAGFVLNGVPTSADYLDYYHYGYRSPSSKPGRTRRSLPGGKRSAVQPADVPTGHQT